MGKKDARIDAYIAKSADFAKPILNHIRKSVHAACPDVEETLKWGFPHFMHKGMLCSMASFKNHCSFGFWKGALILGKNKEAGKLEDEAMGQFGRITALSDLPRDAVLTGYIKEGARINEAGIKLPAKTRPKEKKELAVPDYFIAALKKIRRLWRLLKISPSATKRSTWNGLPRRKAKRRGRGGWPQPLIGWRKENQGIGSI